jgi:hypothetical protein
MNYFSKSAASTLAIGLLGFSALTTLAQPSPPSQPSQPSPSESAAPASPGVNPTAPEVSPTAPAPTSGWRTVKSDDGFSLSFPQEPEKSTERENDGTTYNFLKVNQGGEVYLVNSFSLADLAQLSPTEVREILKKMPTELVKAVGGKVTKERAIALQQNPGREFDFQIDKNGQKSLGQGRIYIVGTKVHVILATAKTKNRQRFLKSFRLLAK